MEDMGRIEPCAVQSVTYSAMAEAARRTRATIFTLNMMHIRLLAQDREFRESYRIASLISLDSNCLNKYFLRGSMRVGTGSDFVRFLRATAALRDKSILIFGNISAAEARAVMPCRELAVMRPAFGFIRDSGAVAELVAAARAAAPDVILIAVGSPQSEKLALRLRRAGVGEASILCCGAALEFETGAQVRSPDLLKRGGAEWMWRLTRDPRRLGRRYLADAGFILSLFGQFRRLARSRTLALGDMLLEFRADPPGAPPASPPGSAPA